MTGSPSGVPPGLLTVTVRRKYRAFTGSNGKSFLGPMPAPVTTVFHWSSICAWMVYLLGATAADGVSAANKAGMPAMVKMPARQGMSGRMVIIIWGERLIRLRT